MTPADRMTGFGIINKSPVECQIPLACEDRTYSLQNKKLNSKSSIRKTNKQVAETLYIKVRCTSFDMPTQLTVNTNKLGLKLKIRWTRPLPIPNFQLLRQAKDPDALDLLLQKVVCLIGGLIMSS